MIRKGRPYKEVRQEVLQDPVVASRYLQEALKESLTAFQKALFVVAQARQISEVAKSAGVQRETLYHALSEDGNPTLQTLASVLDAVGLRLSVESKAAPPSGH